MADGRYSVVPTNAAPIPAPDEDERRKAAPSATGRYSLPVDTSSAFLPGLAQGASMEWGDELAGLVGKKEAYQDWVKRAQEQSPGTYQAGKFGGAVATSLLPAGWLMRGARVAGEVPTLWNMARTGAGLGAATGAVEALGESESGDPLQAAGKTALGAVAGGATGAVLPPLAYAGLSGLRAGGRFLRDAATRDGTASALRMTEEALRRQGTAPADLSGQLLADAAPQVRNLHTNNPDALAFILRATQQGQTPTQVSANLRMQGHTIAPQQVGRILAGFDRATPVPRDLIKLSEELTGDEAGRAGLTNLMQGVTTLPGEARTIALRNMGATMEGSPQRIVDRLTTETGADLQFRQAINTRVTQRAQQANQDYGAAYRVFPTLPTAELQPILGRFGQEAAEIGGETGSRLRQGIQIMQRGIFPDHALDTNLWERFRNVRGDLDTYMSGLRSGASPDNNALRLLGDMRRELNARVHARNPLFQAADERFASSSAQQEAMQLGRSMPIKSGQAQDDILNQIRAMERRNPGHAEELRDHFMTGMMRRVADEVETAGGVPTRWIQPHTGGIRPGPQQTMQQALGERLAQAPQGPPTQAGRPPAPVMQRYPAGEQTAQGVTGVLEDEARLRKIFTDVWGNSKTAERMAAQEDVRQLPGMAAEMATGGFAGFRNAVAKRLMTAMAERNNAQIARIVTETDPHTLYLALAEIRRMAPHIHAGERLMGVPSLAIGAAAGQTATGR